MNQKNDNLEFDKSVNKNSNNNLLNNQNKRNVLIKKIMDKYGLSFQEANEILIRFEKKEKVKNNSNVRLSEKVSNFKSDANVVNNKIGLERENVNRLKEQKNINNIIFIN